MAYIGQVSEYTEFLKQSLTGDSSTTAFTLDQSAGNASGLLVSVGGSVQEPDEAYTVSGYTITFSVAPPTGYTVYIVFLGKELTVANPADNSITSSAIVDGAITNAKIATMSASKITGALPAIDGSAITGVVSDVSVINDNIAVLGFKIASNNSLTRYNMVDQVIEEYQDDDGLLTQTNVDRNASAYVNTVTGTQVAGTGGTNSGIWTSTTNQGLMYSGSSRYVFTDDLTLEWWQKTSSNNSGVGALWGTTNQVAWTGDAWHVNYDTNNIKLGIGGPGISTTFTFGSSSHDGAWHHMALVRNSGVFRAYRDGVASSVTYNSTTDIGNASFPGELGNRTPGGGTYSFNGLLDNWRLSNSCRYPSGTTFSVPGNFTNDANTMLLQDFERADFSACYGVSGTSVAVTSIFGNVTRGTDVVSAFSTEYATNATGTLISTSNTASTAPTKGDLVVLVDDPYTASTINTDIKGYVSRDGGSGWDQATLVDQGTWGSTNKKILSAHDVSFSNSASGTDMKYKFEWANQSYTAAVAEVPAAYETGDRSSTITVTKNGFTTNEGNISQVVDGLNGTTYQDGSRFVFNNQTPSAGTYLRFQHTTAKTFTEVKWYGCSSANGIWKWQGSNDSSSFTDIGSSFTLGGVGWQGSVASTIQTQTTMSANATAYTYYQLTWVSGALNGNDYQAEVEFKTAAIAGTPETGKITRIHATSLAWA